jgi:hypothetical protein
MNHPLQCQCGTLKGTLTHPKSVNRLVCYCRDCQAFAHFLGKASETLDAQGGTEVIQTVPAHLTFTAGQEVLACVRLSEKGLIRWYASCCHTPIGNTLSDYRISFIGLVHTCLQTPEKSLDSAFGPIRMRAFAKGAKGGGVKSNPLAMTSGILRMIAMLTRARVTGAYKRTPLFSPDTGAPIATPKILSAAEREAVYKNV